MRKIFKSLYAALPFKKDLYLILKKIWDPKENVYRHLHFKGVFEVKVDKRTSFMMRHYGYQIENELFWNGLTGGWEGRSMELWVSLCRISSVIFDIGANTGVYSLVAKAVHPQACVHAFEPVKRVYEKLVENNRINGFDIVCHEVAASNSDGQAVIYDTLDDHILSVTVNKNMNPASNKAVAVPIKTVKLSSLLDSQEIGTVNLIKMDVETHEPEVLEGLEPYLSRHKPAMLIEVLNDEIAARIEKIVGGKDYLYFNIDEAKGIRRTESIVKSDYYNYLVCLPDTARWLGISSL